MAGITTTSLGYLVSFDLPRNFVPKIFEEKYAIYLEQYQKPYASIYDFLNQTIKEVNFPALTLPTVEQKGQYGKVRPYRGSIAPTDTLGQEITLSFEISEFHMSYFIMLDLMLYHYMTPTATHLNDFVITTLDNDRNGVFRIRFQDLVLKGMGDTKFSFADVSTDPKLSNVTFTYYDFEIEYLPRFADDAVSGDMLDEGYYDDTVEN